jgi:hypothetical protein
MPSISFVSGLQHLAAETASCIHDKSIFAWFPFYMRLEMVGEHHLMSYGCMYILIAEFFWNCQMFKLTEVTSRSTNRVQNVIISMYFDLISHRCN